MKKIIIFILVLTLFITGCGKKKEKKVEPVTSKYNLSGLVIEYSSASVMYYNAPKYEVKLYADKYITYGYSDEEEFERVDLDDEDYDKIINYAFSDKFMNLSGNLTDPEVLDGSHSSITLYADNKVVKSIGGDNVSNRKYNRLVRLLLNKRREK